MVENETRVILHTPCDSETILNQSFAWGQLLTLLGYESETLGCEIKKVDRFFPSSKGCHVCGWIKSDLTLKDR